MGLSRDLPSAISDPPLVVCQFTIPQLTIVHRSTPRSTFSRVLVTVLPALMPTFQQPSALWNPLWQTLFRFIVFVCSVVTAIMPHERIVCQYDSLNSRRRRSVALRTRHVHRSPALAAQLPARQQRRLARIAARSAKAQGRPGCARRHRRQERSIGRRPFASCTSAPPALSLIHI